MLQERIDVLPQQRVVPAELVQERGARIARQRPRLTTTYSAGQPNATARRWSAYCR